MTKTEAGTVRPLSSRGRPLAPILWELRYTPGDPGEAVLVAWAEPEGPDGPRLSILPCRARVERWSDGRWRVAGQRVGRRTAAQAVEDYIHHREGTPSWVRTPNALED